MASGGYITTNLVTGVTGTTPETAFPATNLYDGNASKPTRWAAGSISITVSASSNCTGIGICGHNIVAGGACTINSASVTVSEGLPIWYKFPTATNSAVIAINGGGVSKVGIGEIVMGNYTEFPTNFAYGWTETRVYQNDVHETEYGLQHVYEKANFAVIQLPFNMVNSATVTALRTLYQSKKGSLTPFLLILDTTAGPCYFGRLTNGFNTSYATLGRNNSALEFREDPIGAFLS
jgi:hypothetical protein